MCFSSEFAFHFKIYLKAFVHKHEDQEHSQRELLTQLKAKSLLKASSEDRGTLSGPLNYLLAELGQNREHRFDYQPVPFTSLYKIVFPIHWKQFSKLKAALLLPDQSGLPKLTT